MSSRWKSFLLGALAAAMLLVAGAVAVVLTGGYNVAATDAHSSLGAWALNTNFTRSVQRQADGVEQPGELTRAMVDAGAGEYKTMCEHCHGGVGTGRAEWAEGMRPKPPALAEAADDWSAAEVFWLVRHGAKMTGMPAFGETHDDTTMWNIAAFVKAMPDMSAEQYAAYAAVHGGETGEGEGGHAHAPGTPPHED